ncbi:uncharacterized protein TNCT_629561 [Trichonephila clavata]|uniref:Uncharacterized protein n=1 Tax=Trichonephila clavata TaxID=2740835 RepID=A0A8X6F459_TRICU|nr:uncharacterized protein TNCT_629561 [Trichonephila clavata]
MHMPLLASPARDTILSVVCGGRVACVAGDGFEVRSAENILEVEGLGSGWLVGGDSFISRNPPWLRPWTVPGSTLWGFPHRLALKNPPAVTLGTLEKCGNSGSGTGRIRVAKNNGYNERIFRFGYGKRFASAPRKISLSWADRVESSTLSPESIHSSKSSPKEEQQISNNRYFIMSKTDTFSNVSPFLVEKGITSSVGEVKTLRKMRSGDLFIEVSSSKQALAFASLKRLPHFDVNVKPHASLNFSRGVISAADLYNVSTEEILENMADQKVCGVKRITIRLNEARRVVSSRTPVSGVSYAAVAKKTTKEVAIQTEPPELSISDSPTQTNIITSDPADTVKPVSPKKKSKKQKNSDKGIWGIIK